MAKKRKLDATNSLAMTHPEIASQWHPQKNGNLKPNDFLSGNCNKIWWKCPIADDHEWEAPIGNRVRNYDSGYKGNGCPCCHGLKVVLSNCFATTHSEIASSWHPSKNDDLTPYDFTAFSGKKIWWKCPVADDHEWETTIANRVSHGCPCCNNRKIVKSNCLATTHPDLVKEWHLIKNSDLTPYDVVIGTTKTKVWWQCPLFDDHVYPTFPKDRMETGCPYCRGLKVAKSNSLLTLYPDLAKEWHPIKNGNITPDMVGIGTGKYGKIWWLGNCGHEWPALIKSRVKGSGCPVCCESRGEKAIRKYLDDNSIKYKDQFRIASCKNIHSLPFDFAIEPDDKMKLVEYNGIQHYEPIIYFKKKPLALVQKRDKIKKNWCQQNDIPLLIIPYWDFDRVEEKLEEFLMAG